MNWGKLSEVTMSQTNKKRSLFDRFLREEEISCFDVKAIGDEEGTVLYRSYLDTALGTMPLYVILDSSIYTVIRVVVGGGIVTENNRVALMEFANAANRQYKKFKFYVEDSDQTFYLDCVYMSRSEEFVPQLLYGLMNSIIEYIDAAVPSLQAAMNIDRLPEPFQGHHHEHDELDTIHEGPRPSMSGHDVASNTANQSAKLSSPEMANDVQKNTAQKTESEQEMGLL